MSRVPDEPRVHDEPRVPDERPPRSPAGSPSTGSGVVARARALAATVRNPVRDEARRMLAQNWRGLADDMRVPQQMFGRQGNGCGATIGAMPRCDFACRGCYLNADANRVPAESVEAIKAQMRALRPVLGHAGNLQLTDGEVTLRPVEEVAELLRYARSLGLIPMLMTHGDSFRRRPGLLERLMVEGGLAEVSIHVDTTQRGRLGDAYRRARNEDELEPLREEFAAIIRRAQRATGRVLRAATTMTVTRENVDGVASVVRWVARNADAFRLISFQPIAQVGRTEAGYGGGVDVDELWDRVADGLGIAGGSKRMTRMGVWFGHRACNRMVNGTVVHHDRGGIAFAPLRDEDDRASVRVVDGFLARFGGVSFRLDGAAERVARMVGIGVAAPGFVARNVGAYVAYWLRHAGGGRVGRGAWRLLTRRARFTPLVVVSHHFMSREELDTPLGRDRLAHCVFRVPVDGELVSMCEVNALGIREGYYERLSRRAAPPVAAAGCAPVVDDGVPTADG